MYGFSIGQLAKSAHVSIDTIRFYERAGLLTPTVRRPSGFREYSESELQTLVFIRDGRLLGFSLEEIGELLALTCETDAAVGQQGVDRALTVVDQRIEQLRDWRRSVRGLLVRDVVHDGDSRTAAGVASHGAADARRDSYIEKS